MLPHCIVVKAFGLGEPPPTLLLLGRAGGCRFIRGHLPTF
jgi:hypothetical protein